MAPKIKLFYFKFRGRGELLRLLLHAAGVEFEDKRVDFNTEWAAIKPKTPEGTLPYIEIEGKQFGEALPLARFLARKYNIAGKTDFDQLKVDIILNFVEDIRSTMIRIKNDKLLNDEQKKQLEAKLKTEMFPQMLGKVEKKLTESKSGFLVGEGLTVADLAVLDLMDTPLLTWPNLLDKSPKVAAHRKKIQTIPNIAKYLSTRPQTPM